MRVKIILDTQLMVLLTVGATSAKIIRKHKNLTEFSEDDFDLLLLLVGDDPKFMLLPNIVSEASNLLRHHANPEKIAIMKTFSKLIVGNDETYVESAAVVKRSEYEWLGVTDTAIIEICRSGYEILTADAELHNEAVKRGLRSTNFNHKREEFGIL